MQNRSPYLPLALGVIAVSFSAVFIKLSTAPSLVIASYRQLFATLILAPIAGGAIAGNTRHQSAQSIADDSCRGILSPTFCHG